MTDISALLSQTSGIKHGFGSRQALLPTSLASYQTTLPLKKQVHGTNIVEVTEPQQDCGEADGFYTEQPGILLAVFTADCLPLIFSRRDGSAVAVLHAGWRGLIDGIIEQLARRINLTGSTGDWVASIGPAAGACCYEVSQVLVDEFRQRLDFPASLISPSHRHLDLAAIAEAKIKQAGFHALDRAGSCTICTKHTDEPFKSLYTSYRRNSLRRAIDPTHRGVSGRNQQSGIVILPS